MQFNTLRHSKYATMMFLWHLHVGDAAGEGSFTCNKCDCHLSSMDERWHCNTCEDYDMCTDCFKQDEHEHVVVKVGMSGMSLLDDDDKKGLGAQAAGAQINGAGAQAAGAQAPGTRVNIGTVLAAILHASKCQDADCTVDHCHKMKRVIGHVKSCPKGGVPAGCPVCKQFVQVSLNHARTCNAAQCLVPFCLMLRQRQMRQRNKLAANKRRQMMMLQGGQPGAPLGLVAPATATALAVTPPMQPAAAAVGAAVPQKGQVNPQMVWESLAKLC
jgi:E1A/CREB-binding protein